MHVLPAAASHDDFNGGPMLFRGVKVRLHFPPPAKRVRDNHAFTAGERIGGALLAPLMCLLDLGAIIAAVLIEPHVGFVVMAQAKSTRLCALPATGDSANQSEFMHCEKEF